ncbi:RagB/SusD family nutrient uptake outer membrane protein [Pedobacter sp. MR2016-24]|uniref:RagB/SusD family nutrient uptake outer membrane protein n=1 Tax=Pedobacter sp. MR2016-24 TaxID=2994466 RepID=UPI0022451099|nr:RagB/SusD family nutrient uptake outer membrane protein [Pedobacter sp. MR2016-24]MCX2483334.1 RagB/SusD family nutrient uptake outer membrane protein [Pedobacter sp. MR2016-24]
MKLDHTFKIFAAVGLVLLLGSCKKLIDVGPSKTELLTTTVFKDSATVQSTLAGLYESFAPQTGAYRNSISTLLALSADELQYNGNNFDAFTNNAILSTDGNAAGIWEDSYKTIYVANAILEGVSSADGISLRFKHQASAEARFIRAFCYFYLVNVYGDVPLVLSTDVSKNANMARTAAAEVYSQIIEDLKFAQANLPSDYSISDGSRTRANRWVATAMLARVYLYNKNWTAAETQASSIINNESLFELNANLNSVFSATSKEAIWQLYNDNSGYTWYATEVLPNPVTQIPTYFLTPALLGAFETNDARKANWVGSTIYSELVYSYPYKYRSLQSGSNTEYYTILRLAELYLIRAEARAQLGNTTGAREDIFVLRGRAGLGNTPAVDKEGLLLAIEQERRIELNSEWGHRWLDLKRTGRINAVLGAVKPSWKPSAALYPVPNGQRILNRSLTQNPGYN